MHYPFIARIGTRLTLSFAALLALLMVLAWLTLARMQALSEAFQRLADSQLETLALTAEVGSQADVIARKLPLMLSAPPALRKPAHAEIAQANRRLDQLMAQLAVRLPETERQLRYQALEARLIEYRQSFRETVDRIEAGNPEGARRFLVEDTDQALNQLAEARDALATAEQQMTAASARGLDERLQADRRLVLALCLTAVASGTLFAWVVTRSIVRPLGRAEEAARRLANGEYTSRVPVTTHDEVGRVSVALNTLAEAVGEREDRIHRLANTDSLTGLPQRSRFLVDGGLLLDQMRHRGEAAALLCFDIDRLKTINAILGFDAGDAVIVDAARRLASLLGPQARMARLAGGTFACLVPVRDAAMATALAAALRQEIEHKVAWQGQALDLAITAGMALCPEHATALEPLLRQAEQALFEAKRTRSDLALYAPTLEASRSSHLSLLSDLREAIEEGQLRMFLQPKLTPQGRLQGAEALVRWRHPQRGWVPPVDFVPFAERTGRIRALTDWMLNQAIATLARWRQEGQTLTIAVNVSTRDIQDLSLPTRIHSLLQRHAVEPQWLQIELTESGLMDSGQDPIDVLHSLRKIGVWLALDDFGTGHSSLAYLQQLPMNELKVDRSFVRDVHADERRRELLGSIVRLGHSLGLKVTAEGAEARAELEVLSDAGCDLVQGYLFAKPMACDDFEAWCITTAPGLNPDNLGGGFTPNAAGSPARGPGPVGLVLVSAPQEVS